MLHWLILEKNTTAADSIVVRFVVVGIGHSRAFSADVAAPHQCEAVKVISTPPLAGLLACNHSRC